MSASPQPPVPASEPEPPPEPVTPGTGLPIPVAAGLACLFLLPGGLIFWYFDRKEPLVRSYSIFGIVLGSVAAFLSVLWWIIHMTIGAIPVLGWILIWLLGVIFGIFWLAWAGIWCLGVFLAFTGRKFRVPFLPSIIKRYISKIP